MIEFGCRCTRSTVTSSGRLTRLTTTCSIWIGWSAAIAGAALAAMVLLARSREAARGRGAAMVPLSQQDVLAADAMPRLGALYKDMKPMLRFLCEAVGAAF